MYDVFGLGNAIVDTEIRIDDSFLTQYGINKGHMTLIDTDRMVTLLEALKDQPQARTSGGSAANSIYAIQALGFKTAYGCKVADDENGRFFLEHMREGGTEIDTSALTTSGRSGQSLILITTDAERTMNTDLGISAELSVADLDLARLRGAQYFYAEGYLCSSEDSSKAVATGREASADTEVAFALSLSDPSMVEAFRAPLTTMMGNGVDVIFCNEEEALTWAKTDRLDLAFKELKDISPEVYITLGAQGSVAIDRGQVHQAPGFPARALDTTGAGDMYAGACLAARLEGAEPREAARFANYCAAALVALYGARLGPPSDYQALRKAYPS